MRPEASDLINPDGQQQGTSASASVAVAIVGQLPDGWVAVHVVAAGVCEATAVDPMDMTTWAPLVAQVSACGVSTATVRDALAAALEGHAVRADSIAAAELEDADSDFNPADEELKASA